MASEELKIRILLIGDPHFKTSNAEETNILTTDVITALDELKPDFTVVLGDILDTHEKVNLFAMNRATDFLRQVKNHSPHTYILIGNHDRPNNQTFLTEEHPFTSLKEWSKTTIVDRVEKVRFRKEGQNATFVFVPYVPTGRLNEALQTKQLGMETEAFAAVNCFFSHQEYKGAKMNAITSNEGDLWPSDAPMNFSGHIHDYDELQGNLIYVGTPYQIGYADRHDKGVMMVEFVYDSEFSKWRFGGMERFSLNVPTKLTVKMAPEELPTYELPENTHVRIVLDGDPKVIREIMKLHPVKNMVKTGRVKFKIANSSMPSADLSIVSEEGVKPFQTLLLTAVENASKELQTEFQRLFGNSE
jgi:DNA repair exonuclease SbcCD nuclease subunit